MYPHPLHSPHNNDTCSLYVLCTNVHVSKLCEVSNNRVFWINPQVNYIFTMNVGFLVPSHFCCYKLIFFMTDWDFLNSCLLFLYVTFVTAFFYIQQHAKLSSAPLVAQFIWQYIYFPGPHCRMQRGAASKRCNIQSWVEKSSLKSALWTHEQLNLPALLMRTIISWYSRTHSALTIALTSPFESA